MNKRLDKGRNRPLLTVDSTNKKIPKITNPIRLLSSLLSSSSRKESESKSSLINESIDKLIDIAQFFNLIKNRIMKELYFLCV